MGVLIEGLKILFEVIAGVVAMILGFGAFIVIGTMVLSGLIWLVAQLVS